MIKLNDEIVNINHFPDGTLLLKEEGEWSGGGAYKIEWYFENNEELVALMFLTKHLRSYDNIRKINLLLPYIPNARQDRVKTTEDVFTLKYFAGVINSLCFKTVTVLDPHSSVSEALIDNIIIQNIIGDTLTDAERSNRFIRRTLPFLPNCKQIRGNKTLITLMLRKVLFEEGLSLNKENIASEILDQKPQYNNRIEDSPIDSMYLGNEFRENITTFTISYWSDEECSENFNQFLEELETYRIFIKDYFLSIEEDLCFYITSDYPTLRLSDDIIYNYLNFNTNL